MSCAVKTTALYSLHFHLNLHTYAPDSAYFSPVHSAWNCGPYFKLTEVADVGNYPKLPQFVPALNVIFTALTPVLTFQLGQHFHTICVILTFWANLLHFASPLTTGPGLQTVIVTGVYKAPYIWET